MPDEHVAFPKPTKKRRRNSYGRGAKKSATELHSFIVRSIQRCESCGLECDCRRANLSHGVSCPLQAAHIIGRKYSATRTLFNNAFCLCGSCHANFTDHPLEFARFVTTTPLRSVYDQLYELSQLNQKYPKTFWTDRLAELRGVKKAIDKGELTLKEAREQEAKEEGLI